jgi:uncharacterized protein
LAHLRLLLRELGGVVIGYSGGVDSTFLSVVANDELGERALCVIASSATRSPSALRDGIEMANRLGLNLMQIETDELDNEDFLCNTPERCYHCKKELFGRLLDIATERGMPWVADGENMDDLDDHRPGRRAAAEMGIRSPLREAGFTKDEIRGVSLRIGLPTWDKPATACLATRIEYGIRIEPEILARIDEAEEFLRKFGFRQVRVRHHGTIARIEVEPEEITRLASPDLRDAIAQKFEELGYSYTTLDIRGYRMGSMNAVLK